MSKPLPYFCPLCDRQGNKFSLCSRGAPNTIGANQSAGMIVVCAAGHKFPYDKFMSLKPRMQQAVFTEKQPVGSVAQPFWVHPEALAAMQVRWPNNLLTTLYSLFNALAHQDSFIVEPEYAVELAKKGITKGREVMGLLTENDNLKLQIVALEERVKNRPKGAATPLADPRMDLILAALAGANIQIPNLLPSNSLPAGDPAKVTPLRRNILEGIDLDTGNYVGEVETEDGGQFVQPDNIEPDEFVEDADNLVEPLSPRIAPTGIPRPSTPLR
jgi:hypothetical protein